MTIRSLAAAAEEALGINVVIAANGRAAHYADETQQWYWLTADDLRYAVTCAQEYDTDAYSHWCAGTGRPVVSQRSIRMLED